MTNPQAELTSDAPHVPPYVPLLPLAAAFICGIVSASFNLPIAVWAWAGAALAVVLGLAVAAWRMKSPAVQTAAPAIRTFLAACAAFCAGGAVMSNHLAIGPDSLSQLVDAHQQRIVKIRATLLESPRTLRQPQDNPLLQAVSRDDSSLLLLDAEAVQLGGQWRAASGKLRLIVNQPLPPQLDRRPRTGDRIIATLLLGHFSEPLNPGQADIRRTNALVGITTTASTVNWQNVQWQRPHWSSLRGWMGAVRQRWLMALKSAGDSAATVLPAMVLGDRDALSQEQEQFFAEAGVMHYLAVSGLHVALAAALLIGILRLMAVPPRQRGIIVILFVICYALAAELRPSVVRAGIFLTLLSLATLSGRRTNLLNTLAAAAIIVLVMRPGDIFQPGFQLSFVVVFGLIIGTRRMRLRLFGNHLWQKFADSSPLRRMIWRGQRILEDYIAVSLTAWLFSAPLLAHHFGMVAPIGALATLIVFPLALMLMALGLLSVLFSQFALPLGASVVTLAEAPAELLVTVVRTMADLPAACLQTPPFHWTHVLLTLMLLTGWIFRPALHLGRIRLTAAAAVAAASFVIFALPAGPGDNNVRITVLAVGNGDTIILQGPHGYNLLIDCGSSLYARHTADSITLPALRRLGVNRLDAVLLTHADADHLKDLPSLLRRIPIGRVYVSPQFRDDAGFPAILSALLQKQGVPMQTIRAGDTLPMPEGPALRVLYPPDDLPQSSDNNRSSIVLGVEFSGGGPSMLLCGDAPGEVLGGLVAQGCRCHVMVLPHHGEQTASVTAAVAVLRPEAAVISVSRQRDLGRSQAHNWPADLRLYRTWQHGAITVNLSRSGFSIEHFVTENSSGN